MKVLVACEESGRVRDEFLALGHDAVSLDILPTSAPGPHRQEPLTAEVLAEGWDLVIAFPPCTKLSNIGARYWSRHQADGSQQAAVEFVRMIWDTPGARVAIENPAGWLNSNWQRPTQIVNPWQFGGPYLKQTCLWLLGLPPLAPTVTEKPEKLDYWVTSQRHSGTYNPDSGIGRKNPRIRAQTFPGIARAMAQAWG